MRKWMVFGLALVAVLLMLYTGLNALSANQERTGLFFTFVSVMTIIGLAIDLINHLRTRRSM
jgi:choline-glycine betaine transporter